MQKVTKNDLTKKVPPLFLNSSNRETNSRFQSSLLALAVLSTFALPVAAQNHTFEGTDHKKIAEDILEAGLTSSDNLSVSYIGNDSYYGAALASQSAIDITVNNLTAHSSQKGIATKEPNQNITIKASGNVEITSSQAAIHSASDSGLGSGAVTINAAGDVILRSTGGFAVHGNTSGDITINAGGRFEAYSMSGISNTSKGNLTVNAQSVLIDTEEHYGVVSLGEGDLTVTATEDISITNHNSEGTAVEARSSGTLKLDAGRSTIVTGNIKTKNDATIDIRFKGSGSVFTGAVIKDGTDDYTNLTMTDGATWNVTGESTVGDLTLDDGRVDLSQTTQNVKVNTLDGNGTVVFDAGSTNVLNVETESDAHITAVASKTADTVTAEQAADMLDRAGGENVDNKTAIVNEGMYNGAIVVDANGNVRTSTNSLMRDTLTLASASTLSLNRILTNDIRKRLGDLRTSQSEHGVWVRYDGGRLSGSGVENDFNTIQVGIDTKPDAVRFGLAASYTMGDADYRRGGADVDAYSLAAYGTYLADNGFFTDIVGRIATVDTDMTVDGNKDGNMDNMLVSLSAEAGWRFNVTSMFYVEPQVEAAYTHIDSDGLELSDGSKYGFESVESFIGRAGFATGLKCPNNMGDVYLRASVVHEFSGDSAIHGANGAVYEIDGDETWFEYGIGANFNLTPASYFWADVERTGGATLDEDWRATVGFRYNF